MNSKIQWLLQHQTASINLTNISKPKEILQLGTKFQLIDYVYVFRYNIFEIIKNGVSAADTQPADRIYRQAAWLPGWNSKPKSSSGREIRDIIDEHYKELHKDDVSIDIYNFTGYGYSLSELNVFENALITTANKILKNPIVGNTRNISSKFKPDPVISQKIVSFNGSTKPIKKKTAKKSTIIHSIFK